MKVKKNMFLRFFKSLKLNISVMFVIYIQKVKKSFILGIYGSYE